MIYKVFLFLTIISQVACGQSKSIHNSKSFAYIDSLFTKDNYIVEFLDFEFPKDLMDIITRMQKSMAEKKEWATEYISKNYKEGEGLPYNENFGITEEEYKKLKDFNPSGTTVVIKSTTSAKVIRKGDILSFKTIKVEDKIIESLKIDFKHEVLTFMNDTIPFSTELNAPASTPFGEWHGYIWKKETSNLKDRDDIKMDILIAKIIEVDLGKVSKNNKILLRLKYRDVDKGRINSNFDITCYMN